MSRFSHAAMMSLLCMVTLCALAARAEPGAAEVTIGSQTWSTMNLDVSVFRNGDPIPEAQDDEGWTRARNEHKAAWSYYDSDPANGVRFGKVYNWYAVNDSRGLAPAGWHVPSDAEWKTLAGALGGEADPATSKTGFKMKATAGWDDYVRDDDRNGNGSNSSGFGGLPGGFREDTGRSLGSGGVGSWWSSTAISALHAKYFGLMNSAGRVDRTNFSGKGYGRSIRCLKDSPRG